MNGLQKCFFSSYLISCRGVRESLQKIISSADDTLPCFGPRGDGSSISADLAFSLALVRTACTPPSYDVGTVVQLVNSSAQVCTRPSPLKREKEERERERMDFRSTRIMALEKAF